MSDNGRRIINIIISLLAAVIAWTFVVYNDDPMTEVTYKDVPVIFEGEATLVNRGLGVSQVSAETIDVKLRQMRIHTGDISSNSISVIADVSEAVEGENGISLKISGPENTQVLDASKRSISVIAEPASSVEKDIVIEYEGDNHFRVIGSENSKLCQDDLLTLTHIVRHYPLLVSDVIREGKSLGAFTAGKAQGIDFKPL